MGISQQTKNINQLVLGDKAKDKVLRYIPHGLDSNLFYPMTDDEFTTNEFINFKMLYYIVGLDSHPICLSKQ